MKVLLADLGFENAALRVELDAAIARVIDSSHFIGGPELEAFERELAPVGGAAHAIGVSSGTDALLVSLMALGVGAGDEVVTTAFSFFATAGVIARLGARPVFADIDPDTFNLHPEAAAVACGPRTRAVLPVNLYGRPAALPEVSLPIIEDAAQSLGARPPAGLAAAVSFFPTKNLGALGDAGAVLTNDPELAERVRLLRSHGARPKYFHALVGGNFRLDALQAAVLRVKLPHLSTWTRARRANAARYRELLAAASVPAELRVPGDTPDHIYNQFVIRAPRRDELRAHLHAAGIATEIYYPVPFHLQACFAALGYRAGAFPHAERAAAEVLALPVHPTVTSEQQAYVVDTIAGFYRSAA
ncbi:MAG TPA: DegT/DnrJ/EryC1/StrS family aminotransferase [Kofleriaceae bacterium]|nr:DegT/DnrJ/EryC1/StrS family aminotransferase [Kofleriaceae bacterium]